MSEPVFTTGEVAKLVGVNFRTVIRWIDRGELDGYRLPGRGDHRVLLSSLLRFIKKHEMPMPDELRAFTSGPPKVLVVDDEAAMVKAIARIFKRAGWEVYKATDGFQAGMLLMENKPSLMTLDLRMPGLDGFNVLSVARQHFSHQKLKILVVSAESKDRLEQALEDGADTYVEKPFDNESLLKQAKSLLSIE